MVLLILTCWISLYLAFRWSNAAGPIRSSIAFSLVTLCVLTWALTEILSLFHWLNHPALATAWLILNMIVWMAAITARRSGLGTASLQSLAPGGTTLSRAEWGLVAIWLSLVFLTLLVALLRPPNTWDSMTYHMARVATWIQNGSIAFFPSHIERQNHSMPMAEFLILHLQLLSGSDRLANLVQWVAYVSSVLLSSLLAGRLGLGRKGQLFTAVFCASMPMAIFQATSTQTDLITSFFVLGFVYSLIRLIDNGRSGRVTWTLLSMASLGMALLTKGTAYPYCAGLGVVIGCYGLAKGSDSTVRVRLLTCFMVIIAGALVINFAHLARNQAAYGHPFSSSVTQSQFVSGPTARSVSANLVKNSVLHLATPSTEFNAAMDSFLKRLLGDEHSGPGRHYNDAPFQVRFVPSEDYMGNPVHFLAIALAIVLLPLARARRNPMILTLFAALLLAAFISAYLIRWQPWASRLHLPLFFVAVPWATAVIAKVPRVDRKLFLVFMTAALVVALPTLLLNPHARLLPFSPGSHLWNTDRDHLYFVMRSDLLPDYRRATDFIVDHQSDTVGLILGQDTWEYPLRVFAGNHAKANGPHLIHIGPGLASQQPVNSGSAPGYIITSLDELKPCTGHLRLEIALDQLLLDVYKINGQCDSAEPMIEY